LEDLWLAELNAKVKLGFAFKSAGGFAAELVEVSIQLCICGKDLNQALVTAWYLVVMRHKSCTNFIFT
jgi:hypothetical protein